MMGHTLRIIWKYSGGTLRRQFDAACRAVRSAALEKSRQLSKAARPFSRTIELGSSSEIFSRVFNVCSARSMYEISISLLQSRDGLMVYPGMGDARKGFHEICQATCG